MIKFKKLIPLILLVIPSVSFAEVLYNCNYSGVEYILSNNNSNNGKICIVKSNKKYYIKEIILKCDGASFKNCYSSILSGSSLDGYGIEKSLYLMEDYNYRRLKVHTRIYETQNISDNFFDKKFEAENYNGLIIFKGEKNVYTARVGYVQENGHYFSIDNNMVDLKKEKVDLPKKAIIKHKYVFLNNKNELFYKEFEEWIKIDLPNVYDFIYLDNGYLYALTQEGVFNAHKNELSKFELISFSKKSKVEKEFKSENFKGSKIKELGTYFGYEKIYISFDNKIKYYIKMNVADKSINKFKESEKGFDRNAIHYRNSAEKGKISNYVSNVNNINNKNVKYSIDFEAFFLAEFKKEISTKYNKSVKFKKPEKEILYMTNRNSVQIYEEKSLIIDLIKGKNKSYLLRDNGRLEIYNHETKKLEILYNINRIEKEDDTFYMIVDKEFNSVFEGNLPYYGSLGHLFKTKGKGFKINYSDYKSMSEKVRSRYFL